MHRSVPCLLAVMVVATFTGVGAALAAENTDKEHAELAKALASAKVSLARGLAAAATAGRPISAKYEAEEGKLQLSVYTEKDGKFNEVVVDHVTGKVAKSEPITESEDLTHAKDQSGAMAKATVSLSATVSKAVSSNAGFEAVSVFPSLKGGHPVAEVSLHKGADWRTVTEKLD
jgi:hypothetical protein